MNTAIPGKLELTKNNNPLKVYVFTVQKGPLHVEVQEDIRMYLAHTDDGAQELLRKDYPLGMSLSIRQRATVPVEKIVDLLNIPVNGTITETKIETQEGPAAKLDPKNFCYNMLLIADQFVPEGRDRTTLKRIINKLLKGYESHQSTPAS